MPMEINKGKIQGLSLWAKQDAVLEEELAPAGIGQPVTKKNEVYPKKMMLPVGTDSNGQYGTHIQITKSMMDSSAIYFVWFYV